MSPTSASFLRDIRSPILSARMAELVQYMGAPSLGRLTDEQRSLSLAIARRLVMNVAYRIDPEMDFSALWSDWASGGVPVTDDLVLVCFARAEEHRWRSATEDQLALISGGSASMEWDQDLIGISIRWPNEELALAHHELQLVDRRRFDNFGYPALGVADIGDDLFRHLLNEIARWRLHAVSADRKSSAGLGDAVRSAWKQKETEAGMDLVAQRFFHQLLRADLLYDYVNQAILQEDWCVFLALTSVAQAQPYAMMALFFMTSAPSQWGKVLAPLRINDEALSVLEQSLSTLPARAVGLDMRL